MQRTVQMCQEPTPVLVDVFPQLGLQSGLITALTAMAGSVSVVDREIPTLSITPSNHGSHNHFTTALMLSMGRPDSGRMRQVHVTFLGQGPVRLDFRKEGANSMETQLQVEGYFAPARADQDAVAMTAGLARRLLDWLLENQLPTEQDSRMGGFFANKMQRIPYPES